MKKKTQKQKWIFVLFTLLDIFHKLRDIFSLYKNHSKSQHLQLSKVSHYLWKMPFSGVDRLDLDFSCIFRLLLLPFSFMYIITFVKCHHFLWKVVHKLVLCL